MQLATMCEKFGVKNLLMLYKTTVVYYCCGASREGCMQFFRLAFNNFKIVIIVFPISSAVFKTHHST